MLVWETGGVRPEAVDRRLTPETRARSGGEGHPSTSSAMLWDTTYHS